MTEAAEPVIKPLVTKETAKRLLHELYNREAVSCTELDSYDDRNFLVTARLLTGEKNDKEQFVLKVTNCEETDSSIYRQNRIMQLLSEENFPVQSVLPSVQNQLVEKRIFRTPADTSGRLIDREHSIRLLTFLPGRRLCQSTITQQLMESVGEQLGMIDRVLTDRLLPELEKEAARDGKSGWIPPWSMFNMTHQLKLTKFVENVENRTVAEQVIREFCQKVLHNDEMKLTPAFIHGDPNESNILVRDKEEKDEKEKDKDAESVEFAGFLDWQDSHVAFAEFDLAMLIMYISLVVAKQQPDKDPLTLSAPPLIRGFIRSFPLPLINLTHLPLLVAARYAQSLVMGEYSYARDPGNEYLLTTASGWSVLRSMWGDTGDRLAEMGKRWIETAGDNL